MSGCKAVLNIKGEHFGCDKNAPHPSLAHPTQPPEATWGAAAERVEIDRMQAQMVALDAPQPPGMLTDAELDAQIRGEQA